MYLPSIKDVEVAGKRVIVRVDFNVAFGADNTIANDQRIRESIPTIAHLRAHGASVVLLSHLGRPNGKVVPKLSLAPVAKRLSSLLGENVLFAENISVVAPGNIVLYENIRFCPGEEQNDRVFASELAKLGDIFVNDAFGTAHRTHASTIGIASFLPSYAGLLFKREVELIGNAVMRPKHPLLVIIGGGKTPEKIRVIEKLLDVADIIYLGGAVANTFFATWGIGVGVSRVDHEMIEMARNVLWKATRVSARLLLPSDVVVSDAKRNCEPVAIPYDRIPMGFGIFDIGPKARVELGELIQQAGTIIWNGPMGLYEDRRFVVGTIFTCESIARSKATTIVGGGDTITTITDDAILKQITLVSTGGSAMLEFIEKGTLPTIEVLKNGIKKAI